MSANQAPRHAPDEPKARFLALRAEGHSVAAAASMVGTSERTGWRWWKHGREVAVNETPELKDDWIRITRRSQGMQHVVLDILEEYKPYIYNEHPGPLATIARIVASKEVLKHALTYNIYAGTGTDKLQKEKEQAQPRDLAQLVIVINAQQPIEQPDYIDIIASNREAAAKGLIPPNYTEGEAKDA